MKFNASLILSIKDFFFNFFIMRNPYQISWRQVISLQKYKKLLE